MADQLQNTEVLKCRLHSDKKFTDIELELQKVKDDVTNIIHTDLKTMEARLNKQAAMVADIQQLSLNVSALSNNMQQMLEEMKSQNTRLQQLEHKPAKKFEGIMDTIVKLVITAAVTVILVKIGLA
jgi:ribosomal protein L1